MSYAPLNLGTSCVCVKYSPHRQNTSEVKNTYTLGVPGLSK